MTRSLRFAIHTRSLNFLTCSTDVSKTNLIDFIKIPLLPHSCLMPASCCRWLLSIHRRSSQTSPTSHDGRLLSHSSDFSSLRNPLSVGREKGRGQSSPARKHPPRRFDLVCHVAHQRDALLLQQNID